LSRSFAHISEGKMALKNKIRIKSKKRSSVSAVRPGSKFSDKTQKTNKIIALVLIVVVFLVSAWEASQMISQDVPKLKTQLILKLNSDIKGAGAFSPWGAVAIGPDKIMVADNQNNRLLLFNRKGDFIKSWGTSGKNADQFHEPSGMTVDDQGNAYVVDSWNSAIKGFNADGKETAFIDLSNQGFFGPRGIGFDGNNFMVADTGSHRIVLVGSKGNIVSSWGSVGTGEGQFKGPKAVVSDEKGHYYIADTDNNRIQCLDANGKKIRYINLHSSADSVAVDQQGRIYAGTIENDGEIKVFNSNGGILGILVDGSGSGEFFKSVKFMTITPDDLLLLTDGDAVYLYQLPSFSNQK